MTTDEIGLYLVDQVVNNGDNRTFNGQIEGKVPVNHCLKLKVALVFKEEKGLLLILKGN